MANTDRPNGFVPVGTITGAAWTDAVRRYPVDSANATAIFLGDMIMLEDDGNVAPATAGATSLLGACVGVEHSDPGSNTARTLQGGGSYDLNLSLKYLPANTAGYVYVVVDPNALYEVQEDSDVSSLTADAVGSNIDHIANAGSTVTGRSGHELDSDTVTDAVPGAAGFRIVGLVEREDNEVGTNARWIVKINESHFTDTVGL